MSTNHEHPEADGQPDEARRAFLKQAGLAGLAAGSAGVAGVAGVAALGAPEAAEAAALCGEADPQRQVMGGAPIFDDPAAFGQAEVLPPLEDRVLALKQLITDKKLLPPLAIEGYVQYYSEQVGPYIGKAVVAHAWVDKAFRDALLNPQNPKYKPYRNHPDRGPFAAALYIKEFLDQAAAEGRLGFQWPPAQGLQGTLLGPEGTYLRVVANGKEHGNRVHNLVVCTLCSCYPQALLGVQPVWYKSQQYRARSVSAPRSVIREFGESNGNLPQVDAYLNGIDEVRVWDSNSEVRFLVIPEAPAGADLSPANEANLAKLISRDGMIGTRIL